MPDEMDAAIGRTSTAPAPAPAAPTIPQADRYVSFSADVNLSTTETLIALMAMFANERARHVYLMLSTPGGSVREGINLYNVLRAMPFRLTTHNVGGVDSIGTAVFLAGDTRYASPHTSFMFHGVGFTAPGQRLEEKFLRERLDGIEADHRRIGGILQERTQITEASVSELFVQAQTKDAEAAAALGIVHAVQEVRVPDGVPVHALVFQRQAG